MSPEQARGETTDGRTDIYSLGIVIYEMLAGKIPFDGETTVSILLKHVSEQPPPIHGLPTPLQRVLDKALAKNPSERYQTPLKFGDAFNAATQAMAEKNTFLEIVPVSEPFPVPDSDPDQSLIIIDSAPKSLLKRKKWQPIAIGVSMLVAAIFGGAYRTPNRYSNSYPYQYQYRASRYPTDRYAVGPHSCLTFPRW
jgi:serine/threonine protein kinase